MSGAGETGAEGGGLEEDPPAPTPPPQSHLAVQDLSKLVRQSLAFNCGFVLIN